VTHVVRQVQAMKYAFKCHRGRDGDGKDVVCRCYGDLRVVIHTVILLPLLSFSAKMTVSPRATRQVHPVNAAAFHGGYGTFATGGCDGAAPVVLRVHAPISPPGAASVCRGAWTRFAHFGPLLVDARGI
jgi:hypothetical protein